MTKAKTAKVDEFVRIKVSRDVHWRFKIVAAYHSLGADEFLGKLLDLWLETTDVQMPETRPSLPALIRAGGPVHRRD